MIWAVSLDRRAVRDPARAARVVRAVPAEAWLCLHLDRGGARSVVAAGPAAAAALAGVPGRLVVLAPVDRAAGLASLPALAALLRGPGRAVVPLVARRAAPVDEYRVDDEVGSFAGHAPFARLASWRRPARLCFELLRAVLAGAHGYDRLLVRQLPLPRERARLAPALRPVSVLVPHLGAPRWLAASLHAISRVAGPARVLVGLDAPGGRPYRALAADHPAAEFFRARPAPLGPYAIRQALAERARTPYLLFQDSDDASCSDRIAALQRGLRAAGADLIGSHELTVDELAARVIATRFPLDASAALRRCAGHVMLFPSALVRRRAYFAIGGLSTDRAFANDTQFVFRASLSLRLRNVDEFLYLRRRRAGSLTTAPATRLGCPARVALLDAWRRDLRRVEAGRLALAASSLRAIARAAPYQLDDLAAAPVSRAARGGRSRRRG